MPIRLLKRQSDGSFCLTKPFLGDNPPSYAILSHTWLDDSEEVTYEDLMGNAGQSKPGYAKIRFCVDQAAKDGLTHSWVDSCCIKKSSDSELSEAINSMFQWYRRAAKCYVYLSDVSTLEGNLQPELALRGSRWFTRGWTLQELLAPQSVEFFSREGVRLGDKKSFERTINEITGIPINALGGAPLSEFTVEDRMRWAAGRITTRIGDTLEPPSKRRKIRSDIPGIEQTQNLFTKELLLDSLRFDQIDDRFVNIQPGLAKTCKWLIQSTEYLDWLDPDKVSDHHGFFWIKGKPGSGKSTLTKFAFVDAKKAHPSSTILSFFFNARGTGLEKSTTGLYRSLLVQLLGECTGYEQALHFPRMPSQALEERLKTNREMLKNLLANAIQTIDQHDIMIIIDALDECDEDEVREMVDFFEILGEDAVSNGRQLHVLFSSRHYPYVKIQRCVEIILEDQQGHLQDIEKYVTGKLRASKGKQGQQIRKDIVDRASGIFIWVVLVVQIINKELDHGRVHSLRKKLQEIPKDLNELFRRILTRDTQYMGQMKLCLQWVLYARRPMKREEIYFAILSGIEPEKNFLWDSDDISTETMDRFILSSSKGLAEVTKSKVPTVQFIHETVRDFLLKENGLGQRWEDLKINTVGLSHNHLRDCCVNYTRSIITTYITAQDLDRGPIQAKNEAANIRQDISLKYPFLGYVMDNMLNHADSAHAKGISQESFIQEFDLRAWVNLQNIVEKYQLRRFPPDIDLSTVLAARNCPNLIGITPKGWQGVGNRKGRFENPFVAAIAHDNYEAVEALIQSHREMNPGQGQFPLPTDSIATTLIKHAKPALAYRFLSVYQQEVPLTKVIHRTLLWFAVKAGHGQLVKLLLDMSKKNSHDDKVAYGNMLGVSASIGHARIVEYLLEAGVKVDAHEEGSATALYYASTNGHTQVVKLLLEADANANIPCGDCGTALQAASTRKNSAEIIKLLLHRGADVNQKGGIYGNALQAALASDKDEEVVKLLLEAGADVHAQGGYYGNALQAASIRRNGSFAELLVCMGADVKAQGGYYGNALQAAIFTGLKDIIKLLLDQGADVKAQGGFYGNALQAASFGGLEGIVKLVLDQGADVNAEGGYWGNPLQAATAKGNEGIVKLLLDKGADVNATGGEYGSALGALSSPMVREDAKKIIKKLLLDRGAKLA